MVCISRLYNKLKKNNLFRYAYYLINNNLFSSKECLRPNHYHYLKKSYPFLKYINYDSDSHLISVLNNWSKTYELEYLIEYDAVTFIEPNKGFAFTEKRKIIVESLPYDGRYSGPFPKYIYYKKFEILQFEKAVTIFYNWDNYWHFLNDVLGQFCVLEKNNFDFSIPIIVPQRAQEYSYVKYFLKTSYAQKLNIHFQNVNTLIKLEKSIFCKHISNTKELFDFVQSVFEYKNKYVASRLKLFITRSKKRTRYIHNQSDLYSYLESSGYKIVDCDELTFMEQLNIFSSASEIIAVHGAGLGNLIFTPKQNCKIVEIFSEDYIGAHYYWLSKELNLDYKAFTSGPLYEGGINVDIQKLSEVLTKSDTISRL